MLDLKNQSVLQNAYIIQEKARKIKKMLMCKMRYNKIFNKCDLANIKKYEIIFDNIVSDPVDWGLVLKIQLIIAAKRWI